MRFGLVGVASHSCFFFMLHNARLDMSYVFHTRQGLSSIGFAKVVGMWPCGIMSANV